MCLNALGILPIVYLLRWVPTLPVWKKATAVKLRATDRNYI